MEVYTVLGWTRLLINAHATDADNLSARGSIFPPVMVPTRFSDPKTVSSDGQTPVAAGLIRIWARTRRGGSLPFRQPPLIG